MDPRNNIAEDLFYKIRSRFSGLKLGDESGMITVDPAKARFFDFDYVEGEKPIGHISISLAEMNSMKVYYSTGITESMDDSQKDNWYKFLKGLREFSKRRLMSFDTRDITKDNLDKRDYAFLSKTQSKSTVGESSMNESTLYGTNNTSYQKLLDTKLIIKHSKKLTDDQAPGARARNISALFVENQEGERFKYPFIHLAGARAMQRHVANSGLPYDEIGKSIIQMSEEIAQLKSFANYVVRNDLMNSDTNGIVERGQQQLNALKEQMAKLSKQSHYEAYKEAFQAYEQVEVPEEVVEDFVEKFTVKNFKEDIKTVFPVLYRLMQEESNIGYDDIVAMTDSQEEITNEEVKETDHLEMFEKWAMGLGEASAITSQDEEEQAQAVKELQELVGEHFAAGVDGTNAVQSLKGLIDDPELFKQIKEQAKEDPDSCVRPLVKQWLESNAPEVVDQLDFGDMVDEPAAGKEEPQMAADDPDERNEKDDLPFDADDDASDTDEFGNKIKHRARHLARKGMRQAMDVKEVAEFIHSFYDKESGTFPKGPEGVCTMVGKKFGEQAERVARKFVERMAPHQEQGAEELEELSRMRELAGMTQQGVAEGSDRTADKVADALSQKGIKYSSENEKEIISMIPDIMKRMGMDDKTVRYLMSYDEDFVPDVLDMLDREPDDGPKEPKHPQARDYAEEGSVAESQDGTFHVDTKKEPMIDVKVVDYHYDSYAEDIIIELENAETGEPVEINDITSGRAEIENWVQQQMEKERDYSQEGFDLDDYVDKSWKDDDEDDYEFSKKDLKAMRRKEKDPADDDDKMEDLARIKRLAGM